MSDQQEESKDKSYIQEGDIVLADLSSSYYDICRVVYESSKDKNVLHLQSILNSYSTYEKHIQFISLLIPKESLTFQYKTEDNMVLAHNNGQLVMRVCCPTYYMCSQIVQYAKTMSDIYALIQLKETCKNETIQKLLETYIKI